MAYIPNTDADRAIMLEAIGVASMDEIFSQVPAALQLQQPLNIPPRLDQIGLTRRMRMLASKNRHADAMPSFLGAGFYDHYVPPTVGAIVGRAEFYTSYTPYQPEMSQGVLQSIFEFQTLVTQLMAMDVANASMYDGATALAEAAIMAADLTGRKRVAILDTVTPLARAVLETYVRHMHIEVDLVHTSAGEETAQAVREALSPETAALIVQSPNFFGVVEDGPVLGQLAHDAGALFVVSVDPISLGILAPPGEYGADIVVGEGQSLGCPMGYGGPLLGLFATRAKYMRRLPGRIVGQTTDGDGKRAFVMTLRTREQDIRRERATSNICTNVALYALAATVYLATMGRQGLRQVAELSTRKAHYAAERIAEIPGVSLAFPRSMFFKEFAVRTPLSPEMVNEGLLAHEIVGGLPLGPYYPHLADGLLLCVTEQRTREEIDGLVNALREVLAQ